LQLVANNIDWKKIEMERNCENEWN